MSSIPNSVTFYHTLEEVLKRYTDPQWLGAHSPLAAPYLLHHALPTRSAEKADRGRALQRLLQQAVGKLNGKYAERFQQLLQEYYFDNRSVEAVCAKVGLARDAFHTSRKRAIDSLAAVLLQELQPALAPETPPHLPVILVERTTILHECETALRAGQTVLLMGSGGMGKTTLGSRLAHAWGSRQVCWFTIRPGLNDHLSSLLMQLGHFFRQQGAPALWQELIAAQGKVDLNIVLGLVRYTLQQARPQTLLLCIDEIDLLQPASAGDHAQFITFLQNVRGLLPLLLIGQRVALEADHYVTLQGLPPAAVKQWLVQQQIHLTTVERQQVYAYTQGNPHFIALFVTLHQVGEALPAVLQQLAATPSLEFLLGRILQRLGDVERGVLLELAVIQGVAPADIWQQAPMGGALPLLIERHLVQQDGQGAVWLLPAYRQLILAALPATKMTALHAKAAQQYARRGQYTTAAYHYIHAGQTEIAIRLWREFQEAEINGGQAYAARHLFRPLLTLTLRQEIAEELHLLCAHLEHIVGNLTQAQADLQALLWRTPLLTVEADELAGVIANDQGDFATAQNAFAHGIATAEGLLEVRLARMHKGLGWQHVLGKAWERAWQEAQLAAYEVENFKGYVQEESGVYAAAETHYLTALRLAQELQHGQGIAKTSANLSRLYGRLGRYTQAHDHLQQADEHYRRLGKTLAVAGCQLNRCFLYNLAGDHQAALATAQTVNGYLAERNMTTPRRLRGIIDQALAEANLGLDNLTAAAAYAQAVLATEEIGLFPDVYRTLAEIQLKAGNREAALPLISQAITTAQQNKDHYLEAYAWRAAAQIYHACHDLQRAQDAQGCAKALFTRLNLPHEITKLTLTF